MASETTSRLWTPAHLAQADTSVLAPEAQWHPWRWHRELNHWLGRLATGEIRFLAVEVPVRHGKTMLGTLYFPAWWLLVRPNDRIVVTGYNADFARQFGLEIQAIVGRNGEHFPGHPSIMRNFSAAHDWRLAYPHRGGLVAVGVGNPPTGRGANLMVIDDPIKSVNEAYSELERDKMWRHWQFNLRPRLQSGGRVLAIMSRWHEDDFLGRLRKGQADTVRKLGQGFHFLHMPALADPTEEYPDPLGRAPGEALCPQLYGRDELLEIRDDPVTGVGPMAFEALYQNRPTLPEGGMFRVGDWRYTEALPLDVRSFVRRWDLASTEKQQGNDPDWTAGVLMARAPNGFIFVLDARRIRGNPADVESYIAATAEEDDYLWGRPRLGGGKIPVRMAQDPGQAGKSLVSHYARDVMGSEDFGAAPESGDKVVRAAPWSSFVSGHHAYLLGAPETPWCKMFVEEHRQFYRGAHDDLVDAAALGFDDLTEGTGAGGVFRPRPRRR